MLRETLNSQRAETSHSEETCHTSSSEHYNGLIDNIFTNIFAYNKIYPNFAPQYHTRPQYGIKQGIILIKLITNRTN